MRVSQRSNLIGIFLVMFFWAFMATGCSRDKSEVGKYVNSKYPGDFIELKKDGTFLIKEGKSNTAGKYAVKNKIINLVLSDGSGTVCKITEKGITDSVGELWLKK